MKTVDLTEKGHDLETIVAIARDEPVLLVTPDGREFLVAEADDFEREVEALRASPAFQRFLDERSRCSSSVSLAEIESETEAALAAAKKHATPR